MDSSYTYSPLLSSWCKYDHMDSVSHRDLRALKEMSMEEALPRNT